MPSSIALAVRGDARAGWCKHEGTARQPNGASLLLLLQGPSAVAISTSLALAACSTLLLDPFGSVLDLLLTRNYG